MVFRWKQPRFVSSGDPLIYRCLRGLCGSFRRAGFQVHAKTLGMRIIYFMSMCGCTEKRVFVYNRVSGPVRRRRVSGSCHRPSLFLEPWRRVADGRCWTQRTCPRRNIGCAGGALWVFCAARTPSVRATPSRFSGGIGPFLDAPRWTVLTRLRRAGLMHLAGAPVSRVARHGYIYIYIVHTFVALRAVSVPGNTHSNSWSSRNKNRAMNSLSRTWRLVDHRRFLRDECSSLASCLTTELSNSRTESFPVLGWPFAACTESPAARIVLL